MALVFTNLTSFEQSEDIFDLNLASLRNLLKSRLNEHFVIDFVRRNFLTLYINNLLSRSFNQISPSSLENLAAIFRHFSENLQVTNIFSI